jgi:hypothetical protein
LEVKHVIPSQTAALTTVQLLAIYRYDAALISQIAAVQSAKRLWKSSAFKVLKTRPNVSCDGIYMVSVWASENELVLGVADHSNEITAISRLLKLLDIRGSIMTLDGMGCQTASVDTIVKAGADYVIVLKANRRTLLKDTQLAFECIDPGFVPAYHHKGHGRIEIRQCWVTAASDLLDFIAEFKTWSGLQSLVKIVSERRFSDRTETDTR